MKLPILFVHISRVPPSFVSKDMEILSSEFSLESLYYSRRSDVLRLASKVAKASIAFCWFAWDQAAWAVRFSQLLGKKSIVIVGGFDVVHMPEINYGNLLSRKSARRTKYAISKSTKALAVSNSIREDAVSLTERSDIDVVYHGFDSGEFRPGAEKEDIVLTVGEINESNLQRKGLLTFFKAAQLLPDVRFAAVGKVERLPSEFHGLLSLPNLEVPGFVPSEDLLDYMQRAKVYVQVSAHEGFGCSLAEAMLCECIPIVTSRGALPEVVGEAGHYVRFGDPNATAEAIETAISDDSSGKRARRRIQTRFPLEKRREALLENVRKLL
ncbi:MAG: glycosyltransferase family 4 protein [Thermoplasmata archaeon]